MNVKFWEYEFEVIVEAPDYELRRLDRLAQSQTEGWGWGMEFDGDNMRYRFERLRDALVFAIYCRVKVIAAPERFWSLGSD